MPTPGSQHIEALMHDVLHGAVVLPDFQRDFVWKPDDVRELLVSVFGDFYIGTMLYMEALSDESPFALRLVYGVETIRPETKIQSIVKVLLDGQQRTSSLFYALYAPKFSLAGRKNPFLFYLDMRKIIAKEYDEAIVFVNSGNKRELRALSSDENFIPVTEINDLGKLFAHLMETPFKDNFADISSTINRFHAFQIQTIQLDRHTKLDRVVETFERINRTGEPLSIVDLLVARLYSSGITLRRLIQESEERYEFLAADAGITTDFILRVICLIRGLEVRRNVILEIKPEGFLEDWNTACEALEEAYQRLLDTAQGYGVVGFKKWCPFPASLVTLAALLAFLRREGLRTVANYAKIDCWYWITVFANRYNEAINTQTVSDYQRMRDWFVRQEVPEFVEKFQIESVDLNVESRNSATYRGVISLIAKSGARDFQSGRPPRFSETRPQDDHIFPRSVYRADTVLNRTLIESNQHKGSKIPSEYFSAVKSLNGEEHLREVLLSHLIDANGMYSLLQDNLDEFCEFRKVSILHEIQRLTKAPVFET